jgi:hypothetical protein
VFLCSGRLGGQSPQRSVNDVCFYGLSGACLVGFPHTHPAHVHVIDLGQFNAIFKGQKLCFDGACSSHNFAIVPQPTILNVPERKAVIYFKDSFPTKVNVLRAVLNKYIPDRQRLYQCGRILHAFLLPKRKCVLFLVLNEP